MLVRLPVADPKTASRAPPRWPWPALTAAPLRHQAGPEKRLLDRSKKLVAKTQRLTPTFLAELGGHNWLAVDP